MKSKVTSTLLFKCPVTVFELIQAELPRKGALWFPTALQLPLLLAVHGLELQSPLYLLVSGPEKGLCKQVSAMIRRESVQEVKVRSHVQRYLNYQLSLLICTIDGVGLFFLASLFPVDFTDPTILSMKSIL